MGTWGNVKYHHLLQCEHIEVLKRASRSAEITCSSCGDAENQKDNDDIINFDHLLPPTILDFTSRLSQDEVEVTKLQAHIASLLGIPSEAIGVISSDVGGRLVVKSAYIFLSASDIKAMIDRLSSDQ